MTEPDYSSPAYLDEQRAKLRRFFAGFPFFRLMGFELVEVDPGRAVLSMNWRDDLTQPAGIMHGGAIASLVDTSIAHSILLTPQYLAGRDQGQLIVSVDLRIKYLRPVSAGTILCEARITRPGRQIIHTAATVTDAAGKEVATGDSIYMSVHQDRLRKK
jgi:uncharacterized protein (TIGR00369 family)